MDERGECSLLMALPRRVCMFQIIYISQIIVRLLVCPVEELVVINGYHV